MTTYFKIKISVIKLQELPNHIPKLIRAECIRVEDSKQVSPGRYIEDLKADVQRAESSKAVQGIGRIDSRVTTSRSALELEDSKPLEVSSLERS